MPRPAHDLIVVGAGPAGTAAALAALRLRPHASVLLLDKAAFPRDKPCGDAIAPHAVDELRALGAAHAVDGYPPYARLRLRSPGGAESVRSPRRANVVVPRVVFDARLAAAAAEAGASVRHERVRSLRQHRGEVVVNGVHRGRVVVAADGANSTARRLLGVRANRDTNLAVAVRGYAPAPPGPPEQLIAMVAQDWPAYAWSFAIGDGRANVGYGLLRSRFDGGKAVLHGRLADLLPQTRAVPGTLRAHHLPFSPGRPSPAWGRVLLAGDAASLVNPLTGEGIYYALASGRLAGTAALLAPDRPGPRYRRLLDGLLGAHLRHTAVLSRAMRHAPVVDAAVTAAGGSPAVFDELVELGLGRGRLTTATLAVVGRAYRRTR